MIDIDALERLAAEATPGPWTSARDHQLHHAGPVVLADGFAPGSLFVAECAWDATSYKDAEFIAACDPVTVAALVRAVRAAEWVDLDSCLWDGGGGNPSHVLEQLRAALAPFREPPA